MDDPKSGDGEPAGEEPSPEVCRALIESEDRECMVLDVRTPSEFREGHLSGARNLDCYQESFREAIQSLDREKTCIVYCKKGIRGRNAAKILRRAGFRRVYNMRGGFEGWKAAGLPVQK